MIATTGFAAGVERRGHHPGAHPGAWAERLAELWTRSLPADPITLERFTRLVLLDPNFDPGGLRVAWDGDAMVGAAYAVRRLVAMAGDDLEPGRGWIPFFFVDPRFRRRGIGRRLMAEAMAWLGEHGCGEVDFASYTPNYILPGLDRERYPAAAGLLDGIGFGTLYQAVAMDRSLVDYAQPERALERADRLRAQGYRFESPGRDDLAPLIRLAGEHFNPDWARAIREACLAGMQLDRIVLAIEPDGGIAGWGMCGAYEQVIDRFGPFGVRADLRGLGLGEVLLHRCLERMRAIGAHSAWFLWTAEQSPAGRLYVRSDFTITRRFDVMRARL